MNLNQLTAIKIREKRQQAVFTAEAVAKDLGISKAAYSQMENGHTEITLTRIEAVANVYHLPASEFIPLTKINPQIEKSDHYNTNTGDHFDFFADTESRLQEIVNNLNAISEEIHIVSEENK